MNVNIFEQTIRPDEKLFYKRDDPYDPRLGEFVTTFREAYNDASVVILGCPQDEGVKRNKGRVGAKDAPDAIRRELYKLTVPDGATTIFDLGDTRIQPTLEATHELHQKILQQLLLDGKRVIVLGGGNDMSYPDCSALSIVFDHILAFNVDAHFDVRKAEPRNSGTPYRQLLEEGYIKPKNFYELAYQPFCNSTIYKNYLKDIGVNLFGLHRLRAQGINKVLHGILDHQDADAVFWGLDMDSVRASDAPGVSAVNPVGLTAEEFCLIAGIAGRDRRSRILEITEVNPKYDSDRRTASLAAVAIHAFLRNVFA